ncbi:lysylphosphatidylglycerol synthase transmembrane domain-containing protein [Loigolactobacillus bifermentans]|jgi:uncharacterized protein (TIRG00374 family)|uniref:Phosphatidylglycerol lysyltransferase n=1 Tax=Loigolactobacillus bifermentans DSM 20003 TaxID=1423726 RepID=A0A0R1GJW3_9LACO|nr:lysylphosphatidylglycerol synthase transmembrane domain-containing protein [Loigolactobacillus bifermentans]KRK34357.1 integral membrane protein [Loigolactobacillus bifermentans DSM 20003]QGG60059.1 flippase-like domain-containing protein [Loigolactobacillus bifermentans]
MTRKNFWMLIVMLAVGMGIMGYELRQTNLRVLVHSLLHLKLGWLAAAVGCMCLYWLFEALVVRLLLHKRVGHFSFKNALRIPLIEQLFNSITPFSSGGQPAQLVALMKSGVEGGRASSLLLMKFVVFQTAVLVNFIFALLFGFHWLAGKFTYLSWLVIFGFVMHITVISALLMIMYWYRLTKRLVQLLLRPLRLFLAPARVDRWQTQMAEKIDTFYAESLRIKRDRKMLCQAIGLTLVQLFFYYSVPYFVLLALGASANFLQVLVLHIMIVMIISLFPIPGGSGGAELSFKTLFTSFLATNSQLVLALILWRLITYYMGMFIGMFALIVKPDPLETDK